MTKLRLTYYEIMDTDFTAIDAEIISDRHIVARFRNYSPSEIHKEMYTNQAEEFAMPSVAAARDFLQSNRGYSPV